MSTRTTVTSVQSSIFVDAPIERAFSIFTDGIGTWWPPEHHILQAELAETVFEPRQGGHIYDRGAGQASARRQPDLPGRGLRLRIASDARARLGTNRDDLVDRWTG